MPAETGPWWVEDQETGHKFATYELSDHLDVLDEPALAPGGYLRAAEPAEPKPAERKPAPKPEPAPVAQQPAPAQPVPAEVKKETAE